MIDVAVAVGLFTYILKPAFVMSPAFTKTVSGADVDFSVLTKGTP
jgi:hypothetical protein